MCIPKDERERDRTEQRRERKDKLDTQKVAGSDEGAFTENLL